jgi:hypothetical protein
MKIGFLFFILIVSTQNIFTQIDSKKISGVYRRCSYNNCEAIKINKDFTFEYLFYGGVYEGKNKGRLSGNWKFTKKDHINFKAIDEKRFEEMKQLKDQDGITIKPTYPAKIDYLFIIKKDKICKLFLGGISFCFDKMNKKEANKLFVEK